jgi:CHAT domain-containing protein/tetratricopeptide (TPR) repeat protein
MQYRFACRTQVLPPSKTNFTQTQYRAAQHLRAEYTMRTYNEVIRFNRGSRMMQAFRLACAALVAGAILIPQGWAQSPDDLEGLDRRAFQHYQAGQYAAAIPLAEQAVALAERLHGSDGLETGKALQGLALVYLQQGRYSDAEPLYKRALAIMQAVLGVEHSDVGTTLYGLALLYVQQARYADAEPLYKRVIAIKEKALGPDHTEVGSALYGLAALYVYEGRYADAEPLYLRTLDIKQKALGLDHSEVGTTLHNIAVMYVMQQRYGDAEPLYKRVIAIKEKLLGPDHSEVGTALYGLAQLYAQQGRIAQAEPLYRRALAIKEKTLGAEHTEVGTALHGIAQLYVQQRRYRAAEPLQQRVLAIKRKALGPDHPDTSTALGDLAELHFAQGQWAKAVDYWRQSTEVIIRRVKRGIDTTAPAAAGTSASEAEREGYRFKALVKAVHRLAETQRTRAAALADDMFAVVQWAQASDAATSLARMAARQAAGTGDLAHTVRERQDLVGEWQARDRLLVAAASQPTHLRNLALEAEQRSRLAVIDTRLADIDRALAKEFPDYAALAAPGPLTIADVQAMLKPDEALVLLLDTSAQAPTPEETFVWTVTKTQVRWVRSALGTSALTQRVNALRCGLDHTLWAGGTAANTCRQLLNATPGEENAGGQKTKVLPFDLTRAHELYRELLGPVETLIRGKHLLVVTSGPLARLPFSVLVTASPKDATGSKLAAYRAAAWLGTRQPLSVLPSVGSLKALRGLAKTSQATKSYLGIGNPLLDGQQADPVWGADNKARAEAARTRQQCREALGLRIAQATTRPIAGFHSLFRGAQADTEAVRGWMPLPETADELCEVARQLGVPASEVLLGSRATEAELKDLSDGGKLASYAILHFATHGALTGQVLGAAEPGLILTPPPANQQDVQALARDDGFLTASEIATLKLDADWVILSACNTAAGGGLGESSQSLSGMARAFFYAGARALLVSHWEVGSESAVKLTTRALTEMKSNPRTGRAEALRISMRELVQRGALSDAQPSRWAPFVVVGEGAK